MKHRLLIIILCVLLLTGGIFLIVSEGGTSEVSEMELYHMLFDLRNKVTLQLDMDEAELQKMQDDYDKYSAMWSKSPIYRIGDLHVTIETPKGNVYTYEIKEVGVRMKGNTSRTSFYNAEEGIYNIIHLKLSFQETFDKEEYYGADAKEWDKDARKLRKDRTFATLEKLDLRWNRCDDSTYLREHMAYETFREYGVAAPHTNLCSFDWAGIHMGVFCMQEPVDSIFLEKYLPEEAQGGDLYKCGWAGNESASFLRVNSIGIEDEDQGLFYAYDLKTNKKESDHSALTTLIRQINREDITKEDFADLVDMENFLTFSAVSYLLGNPDDMRNNGNNFYIYFRADNGKAIFIPYDFDRCLGINSEWNPTRTSVTDDNPFSTERLSVDRYDENANRVQYNPVIRYSVAAGGFYVREYAQRLSEIAEEKFFRYETFEALYSIAESNYGSLTTPGKAFYNTEGMDLSFDIARSADFASTDNISIGDYLDAKLKTLHHYLPDTEKYAEMEIKFDPVWCIRADFTNWEIDSGYTMTASSGMQCIEIQVQNRAALKVYNSQVDRWYGSECVESSTVEFSTDGHTNIVLTKGSYRILIDPVTERITLEPAQNN